MNSFSPIKPIQGQGRPSHGVNEEEIFIIGRKMSF